MSKLTSTIPKGSWVLVTGITGFIASHTALEFLKLGYNVKGTVRDASKAKWLTEELFPSFAAKGELEIITVPDMSLEGAFDEVVKDVSAVVHIATINTWDANPNNVIPQTVAGVLNVLKAAGNAPSVKRFVYTSSAAAAVMPTPNTNFHCDETSWNTTAVELAWAPPPYEPSRAMVTYMASKVEAEKALWKFVEEEKPSFIVNAVLPFTAIGNILNKNQPGSSAGWVKQLYHGDVSQIQGIPALSYIHVRDVAVMHVAAALDPDVSHKRIHAWAQPFNWNDLLVIMRELYPQKQFVDDLPNMGQLIGTVDDSLGLQLMKKWAGQDGWTPLKEGLKQNVEDLD